MLTVPHKISLALVVACAIWDAYCQANKIPYRPDAWLIGVMLAPYGETAYADVRKLLGKKQS